MNRIEIIGDQNSPLSCDLVKKRGADAKREQSAMGEPIPPVDPAAYFNALKGSGVDQLRALDITFRCLERVEDEGLPVAERRSVAEAMKAAVEALLPRRSPKRPLATVREAIRK